MEEKRRKWINAAKELSENGKALVLCPECEKGILRVKDEPIKEWQKVDRYLICDVCSKWNVITINVPPD